ncbi:MAG: PD-(D/E)XK nuclease family protein [Proteobacteria bacterium]|nr:PD-(D/E)XK nuclease family protein [Pseudomonadota bacterium]
MNEKPPTKPQKLHLLVQQYPNESEISEVEADKRGIPDAWIFDEEGWCILIESKVQATLDNKQISRHRRTAARRGFQTVIAVAIATGRHERTPIDAKIVEWKQIYSWLRQTSTKSLWAERVADYLDRIEAKLVNSQKGLEGTLTQFSGFRFDSDHPYNYLEGKRLLRLALTDFRDRSILEKNLGVNPEPRRSAITGSQEDEVWDFLSLSCAADARNFTKYPHLTPAIMSDAVEAMVTIPNAVSGEVRRKLISLGEDGFRSLVEEIVGNLRPLLNKTPAAQPLMRAVQRRYPSQRSKAIHDARIEFDLRTALPFDTTVKRKAPKTQYQWLSAVYGAFANKHGANYQIQVGVVFPYDRCPLIRTPDALNLMVESWLACKPLVDAMR